MKKNLSSWMCYCCIFFYNVLFLFAQNQPFEPELLTGTQGLSQHYIYSIIQDYRGFIWFGTKDGLNRYDGYTFKVFRNDPFDSTTLSDNYVLTIYEDCDSNLWIGTASGGLNKFNRTTETFTRCPNTVRDSITHSYLFINALLRDDHGKILLGTSGQGLWRYDPTTAHLERLLPMAHGPSTKNNVSSNEFKKAKDASIVQRIYQDREKRIWLTTADVGLILAKDKDGSMPFRKISLYNTTKKNKDGMRVNHIFQSRSGTLWVGTNYGLGRLYPEKDECVFWEIGDRVQEVSHIIETDDSTLWINCFNRFANRHSFIRFNPHTNVFSTVNSSDGMVQKCLESISYLFLDRSGLLWIGTGGYGILKYNPSIEKFGKQRKPLLRYLVEDVFRISHQLQKISLSEFVTPRSIIQQPDSTLWVALDGRGVFCFSLRTQRIVKSYTSLNFPGKQYIPKNTERWIIGHMIKHSSGELWIGTNGGILRMNINTGVVTYLPLYPALDSSNVWLNSTGYPDITALLEDAHNVVWVGTPSLGLIRIDPNNYLTTVFQYDAQDTNSLSNNAILSVEQDPYDKNVLWIGTDGGGVNKFDTFKKTFYRIQERDGLPNNVVYAVLADTNGNLWMSTNKGLARYNLSKRTFRTFTQKQGLQDNEFNRYEYFRDLNGTLYFGGINGCNAFNPSLLRENTTIPSVVLTDFKLFNKSVSLVNTHSPLSSSITETLTLMLNHSQNVLTFEFAALEFSSPLNNSYAYRLKGFDKEWVYSGAVRSVTYTNLDPGYYVFQVKGANSDGVWNETGTSLSIIVTPPYWMTWWFRGIWVLLGIAGVLIVSHFIEQKRTQELMHRAEKEAAVERERLRIARDMHDDLGARLTEIGIIGDLARRNDADISMFREQIEKMTDVARETAAVFDEIVWAVNPRYDRIDHIANYFARYATEYLSNAKIRCKLEIPEALPDIPVAPDIRHNLFMIFKEALNNVAKHAQADIVTIYCIVENNILLLSIADNGKGLDINSETVFSEGMKNMIQRAENIRSTMTVKSSAGRGTEILVNVPLFTTTNEH